jgi:polyhydroxyalkanoate synthesis regulator phasin
MFETLEKLMFAGMGAVSMTREKAEKIFDEAVKKGIAEKEQKARFVSEMVESADKTRADLAKLVADEVRRTLNQMSLATTEDVKRLEQKVDQLLKR